VLSIGLLLDCQPKNNARTYRVFVKTGLPAYFLPLGLKGRIHHNGLVSAGTDGYQVNRRLGQFFDPIKVIARINRQILKPPNA